MTVDLPVLTESRVSHSSLLLSAWTLAVAFVEKSNDVVIANEVGGWVNCFPGDAGPVQRGYGGGREVLQLFGCLRSLLLDFILLQADWIKPQSRCTRI